MQTEERKFNKIFCIGLSKTGTGSLNLAFKMMGLRSAHKRHNKGVRPDCENTSGGHPPILTPETVYHYDAVSDLPIAGKFETLDRMYPDSLFIYTVRELESWLRSLYLELYVLGKNPFHNPFLSGDEEQYQMNMSCYGPPCNGTYFQREWWIMQYVEHGRRIHHYFRNQKHKLLTMDITKGDDWNKLCPFIGIPRPDKKFPHHKRRKYPWVQEDKPIPEGLLY